MDIFLGGCADVALSVDVDPAIGGVEEDPLADVELALEVQHWPLHQLLDDEREVLHALLLLTTGVGSSTLDIRIGIMVVVVLLEYRCFVPGAAPNSIVDAHYITQLIEVLENVNAYASVESSWFEKP